MAGAPTLCMINRNGARYLERSLGAVEPLRASFLEVLLVDDASTDESVRIVRECFPWVRVVELERNGGPGAARNAGLREAESDQILFIDNDVCIPPHAPERLLEVLSQNPRAAVVMARCVYASRPDVIQFDRAYSHFVGLQIVEPHDQPLSEGETEPRAIGSLITSCFLVDRARLGRDIQFDEAFFIYLEDHDFGLRVRGRGHEVMSAPDVSCLHGEGTEHLSIRAVGGYSGRRVFCLMRNRWLVICKNYRVRTLVVLAPALAFYEAAQLAVSVKKAWLGHWLGAAWWMLVHAPEVVRKRRGVLSARVVPDKELLQGGPIPFREELVTSRLERLGRSFLNTVVSAYWSVARHWI